MYLFLQKIKYEIKTAFYICQDLINILYLMYQDQKSSSFSSTVTPAMDLQSLSDCTQGQRIVFQPTQEFAKKHNFTESVVYATIISVFTSSPPAFLVTLSTGTITMIPFTEIINFEVL